MCANLTEAQRAWLQRAARDAAAGSTDLIEHEDHIVADLCQGGARLANASETDLGAMRQAFTPVYASLEQDPQTKSFIAGIEDLKRSTSPGEPLAIPAGCTGQAPGAGSQEQVATDPKGFKLFAVAKDNKIMAWQAKDARGRRLRVTRYEHPASADDSKAPGILKMIVICVETKEVCYEVQLVPTSQR